MDDQERKEYLARKNKEWYQLHQGDPDVKARRREAVRRYNEKMMREDPEGYRARRAETSRKSARKAYRKRDTLTEEELNEERRKTRERVALYRARKKAEKLALEAKKNESKEESASDK